MRATGTLFMSKTRPEVGRNDQGQFRLVLRLLDNLGTEGMEAYQVRWLGPEAEAFWNAQRNNLVPGAVLDVELTHLRAHTGATRPPIPELRGRVVRAQVIPKRTHHPAAAAA